MKSSVTATAVESPARFNDEIKKKRAIFKKVDALGKTIEAGTVFYSINGFPFKEKPLQEGK